MKSHRLFLLIILMLPLFLTIFSPVAAQAVTATTTSNARLRADSNQSAAILVTVPYGMSVNVNGVNSAHSWFNVTYNGITGWMSATVLNVFGNVNSLPIMGAGGGGGGGAVQPPLNGVVVSSTSNLNMRSGPGTSFSRIVVIPARTQVQAIAVNADRTWVQVNFNGQQGWVAVYLIRVINGSLDSLGQSGGGQTGGGTGGTGGTAAISFTVDRTSINSGECVNIRWDVDNINQVYYQGGGVTGHENRTECPGSTTTYVLRVVLQDNSSVERTVTVTVGGGGGQGGVLNFSLGSVNIPLTSGFSGDPYSTYITNGGGSVNANAQLGGNCVGYYTAAPTVNSLIYTAGNTFHLLRFYFIASNGVDATMVINDAGGGWRCNDDFFNTLNPGMDFNNPGSGAYDVWIGALHQGQVAAGTIYVTELNSNHP